MRPWEADVENDIVSFKSDTDSIQRWYLYHISGWTVGQYLRDGWSIAYLDPELLANEFFQKIYIKDVIWPVEGLKKFLNDCDEAAICNAAQLQIIKNAMILLQNLTIDTVDGNIANQRNRPGLRVNKTIAEKKFRKWAFILANTFWDHQVSEQALLNLRSEELLVYNTIILASIQRQMRGRNLTKMDPQPLDSNEITPVSMRRVAEVIHVPRETVRRHIFSLKKKELVTEHPLGGVYAPRSLLVKSRANIPEMRLRLTLNAVNAMISMGVFELDK